MGNVTEEELTYGMYRGAVWCSGREISTADTTELWPKTMQQISCQRYLVAKSYNVQKN